MIDRGELKALAGSDRQDVLSVSLNVDPTKPDHQRANPAYRIQLRKALTDILERVPRERQAEVHALIDRVLARIDNHGHGRGLAIFAAPDLWREYSLRFPLPNRVHYGRPDLYPLLWALDEYKRYGILVVDRERARLLVAFLGRAEVVDEEVLTLNTESWRMTAGRPPTFSRRVGVGVGRGAQRDTFDARVDEQERRFWRHVVAKARHTLQGLGVTRLIIVGPPEAAAAANTLLGDSSAVRVVGVVPAPPRASTAQLRDLTLQAALAAERRREHRLVTDLLEGTGTRGSVVGLSATLAALIAGRAQLVVVDAGHDADVWQCQQCGLIVSDERPVCPNCGSGMTRTPLLYALPMLAYGRGATLETISGEAADLLKPHGGIGASLRYNPILGGV